MKIFNFILLLFFFTSCSDLFEKSLVDCELPSTLLSPENNKFTFYNDTIVDVSVVFKWDNPMSTCYNYNLQISTDSKFIYVLHEVPANKNEDEIVFNGVDDTTTIYWRVKSNPYEEIENKNHIFSEIYSFTLGVPNSIICYKCGTYNCTSVAEISQENVVDTVIQNQTFSFSVEEGDFSGYQFKIMMHFNILGNSFNPVVYGVEDENVIGVYNLQYNAPIVNDILLIGSGLVFDEVNGLVSGTITFEGLYDNYNAYIQFTGSK
jgi:hypothetical protein